MAEQRNIKEVKENTLSIGANKYTIKVMYHYCTTNTITLVRNLTVKQLRQQILCYEHQLTENMVIKRSEFTRELLDNKILSEDTIVEIKGSKKEKR
jgi:hypothetical protein